jgi:hypothetical protein
MRTRQSFRSTAAIAQDASDLFHIPIEYSRLGGPDDPSVPVTRADKIAMFKQRVFSRPVSNGRPCTARCREFPQNHYHGSTNTSVCVMGERRHSRQGKC